MALSGCCLPAAPLSGRYSTIAGHRHRHRRSERGQRCPAALLPY
ncbi:hypothetical protein [Micromonospora wenchangensis]